MKKRWKGFFEQDYLSNCLYNFTAISDDDAFADTSRSASKLLNFLHRCEAQSHVCQLSEDHMFAWMHSY